MTTTTTTTIDARSLHDHLGAGSAPHVLDVRTPAEFESHRIPGALNVPLDDLRKHRDEVSSRLDRNAVLVCKSGNRAKEAEKTLRDSGLEELQVLDGGMEAWHKTGAPVDQGRQVWELERQVRAVAGSITLASILASVVAPKAKWLAAGIGGGLTFAAVTDTCAMGVALSKLPWNRPSEAPDVHSVIESLGQR